MKRKMQGQTIAEVIEEQTVQTLKDQKKQTFFLVLICLFFVVILIVLIALESYQNKKILRLIEETTLNNEKINSKLDATLSLEQRIFEQCYG